MMRSFSDRTQKANELEIPFIRTLNERCQTHRIAKFGIESTDISGIHEYIRFADDVSSQFVRYLPDSVIVRTADSGIGPKTALIEFKVHDTRIKYNSFLDRINEAYQDRKQPQDPELTQKDQVFQVERDALDIYKQIASLEVEVIVIGWQQTTDRLISQYADKIVICNEWIPDPNRRKAGSGTPIYNTHIDSYEPLDVFCRTEFGIQDHVLDAIMQSIRG